MEVQVATDTSAATQAFALAGAALQSERANSHCAEIHARTEIAPRNDVRPRTADYENETYAWRRNRSGNPWGQFCCGHTAAENRRCSARSARDLVLLRLDPAIPGVYL